MMTISPKEKLGFSPGFLAQPQPLSIRFCNGIIEMGLVSLIIFTPLAFGTVQVWSITVVHLITLAVLAAWLIKMNTLGKFKLVKTPLDLPILLFLGIAVITTLTSIYPHTSKIGLYKIINYVLLYYLVVNNIKDSRQIKRIATLVVLVGTSLALYGLFNYFSGIEKIYTLDKKYYLGMLTSTYVNHNHIGGYFELAIPLGIGLVLANQYLPGRRRRSKILPAAFVSVMLIAVTFIMITALVFTYSRGTWIGFLGSMIALGMIISFRFKIFRDWSRLKKWGVLAVLALIIISASLLVPDKVKQRAATMFKFQEGKVTFNVESAGGRLIVYENTLQMIKKYPFLGTGPGTFVHVYPRYRNPGFRIFMNAVHNDYLQYGQEMGIFGLGSFFLLLALFFKKNLSLLKTLNDKYLQGLTLGFLVSIIAIGIHSLGDFNLQIPANALLFWIILALSSSIAVMARPEKRAV